MNKYLKGHVAGYLGLIEIMEGSDDGDCVFELTSRLILSVEKL